MYIKFCPYESGIISVFLFLCVLMTNSTYLMILVPNMCFFDALMWGISHIQYMPRQTSGEKKINTWIQIFFHWGIATSVFSRYLYVTHITRGQIVVCTIQCRLYIMFLSMLLSTNKSFLRGFGIHFGPCSHLHRSMHTSHPSHLMRGYRGPSCSHPALRPQHWAAGTPCFPLLAPLAKGN